MALAIFAWRGTDHDVIAASATLLALGAFAGGVASLYRLPKLLDTAIDIDRQLGTPDLFSSALALLNPTAFTDARFANSVLCSAEAQIQNVTLARLVSRRLGTRAWSGIGLAIAAVLTVATMVGSPAMTRAASDRRSDPPARIRADGQPGTSTKSESSRAASPQVAGNRPTNPTPND